MNGRVDLAVERFRAVVRAEELVAKRNEELKLALARLGPDDLSEYARLTTQEES